MATITRVTTFLNGATILASEHNAELDAILSFLNNSVSHVDGSKPYTALPSLPASDPTTDNQPTRKLYVDSKTNRKLVALQPGALRQTTSVVYVDWPVGEVLSTTFTKAVAGTKLYFTLAVSGWISAGTGIAYYAVDIDGVDTFIGATSYNELSTHRGWTIQSEVAGLAAGARAIKLNVRVDAGITLNCDSGDHLSLKIEEGY